ncbi:MAG: hypothetical protein R3B72_17585 [Polyangiaceae bacterium]
MGKPGVLASEPAVEEMAAAVLADGGGAVDAVLAGFFGAAGRRTGVLLGPIAAVVAGLGLGARVFDGRTCQAGRNAPRPRGFTDADEVPTAAFAAAPRSLATLSLLHAYGAKRPMSALVKGGLAAAKKEEAPARGRLLEAVARQGPRALATSERLRPLLHHAGPTAGGLLTETDLLEARPGDDDASFLSLGGVEIAAVGFSGDDRPLRRAEVVVAADGQGRVAAVCYAPDDDGVAIPELEITLARDGVPIRRGVPRVTPGTLAPMPSPIALARRPSEGWFAALGVAGGQTLDFSQLENAETLSLLGALAEAARAGATSSPHTGAPLALAASVQRSRVQLERR